VEPYRAGIIAATFYLKTFLQKHRFKFNQIIIGCQLLLKMKKKPAGNLRALVLRAEVKDDYPLTGISRPPL
jgi:hypothetical protein